MNSNDFWVSFGNHLEAPASSVPRNATEVGYTNTSWWECEGRVASLDQRWRKHSMHGYRRVSAKLGWFFGCGSFWLTLLSWYLADPPSLQTVVTLEQFLVLTSLSSLFPLSPCRSFTPSHSLALFPSLDSLPFHWSPPAVCAFSLRQPCC